MMYYRVKGEKEFRPVPPTTGKTDMMLSIVAEWIANGKVDLIILETEMSTREFQALMKRSKGESHEEADQSQAYDDNSNSPISGRMRRWKPMANNHPTKQRRRRSRHANLRGPK